MLSVKQLFAATLISINASPIFAGAMGSLPEPWEFGAFALFLQAVDDGNAGYSSFTNYGTDALGNDREVSGAINHLRDLREKWRWGFKLAGRYHFQGSNDLNLNWYHFNHTGHGRLPTNTLFAGGVAGLYAGMLSVKHAWDAVNLEFAHSLPLEGRRRIRFYAGLQFAAITNTFTNYPSLYPNGPALFTTTDNITFRGFGPRIGGDFAYGFCHSFFIYAKPAASLLVGRGRQAVTGYQDYTNSFGVTQYSISNFTQRQSPMVVPELETRLGMDYRYALQNSEILFDLGYLWQTYLQALVNYTAIGYPGSSTGVPSTGNFTLNGLYFGLKWIG